MKLENKFKQLISEERDKIAILYAQGKGNLKCKIHMEKKFIKNISRFFIIVFPLTAWVYAPPTGSPLALNLHPRLLFIPQSYRDANPNAVGITVQEIMLFTRYEYIFNRRELK